MIDNDNDGERELVLGNKQLLGIFFVATLLCGVFFAMGYVVGGNSAKSAVAATAGDTTATPVGGQRDEPSALQTAQPTAVSTDTGANPMGSDTAPQVPGPEPALKDNPAAEQPPANAPLAAVPVPAAPVSKTPQPATATAEIFVSVPEKGTRYWQVTATPRPAADALVQSLRDRHLPAILAESSNPKLFEVLVGPYRSDITLADAKKKLTEIGGFDGLIPKKF